MFSISTLPSRGFSHVSEQMCTGIQASKALYLGCSCKRRYICPISHNTPPASRQSLLGVTPMHERESKTLGFWNPRHVFWIPVIGFRVFCQWNLDSGFHSKNLLDFRFQKQTFPGFRNLGSLTWVNWGMAMQWLS